MRVRIHRGAREIGGNCVELEVASQRLVLDVGRPLVVGPDESVVLPDIPDLGAPGEGSLLGVVLSHPHLDHYGLIDHVARSVPIYTGEAAAALLRASTFFSPSGVSLELAGFLRDRESMKLGPFTLTPYLVDHSAFDSYALLVDGGGRRLFYSGDFREHGRKASIMRSLREQPPANVDVLLLEGTRVGRDDRPGACAESDVESAMVGAFRSSRGLVAVVASTQNIDRLVSVYRACRRAGRTLVVDLYAATIAAAIGRKSIPQPGFPALRVYVPQRQRKLVKRAREFERVDSLRLHRIYLEEIRDRSSELVMLVQGSTLRELICASCLDTGSVIWSLWPGYLEQSSGSGIPRLLDDHQVPLIRLHASGHAPVGDLRRMVAALAPARVVPIHTSAPQLFEGIFERVDVHGDGEWWEA